MKETWFTYILYSIKTGKLFTGTSKDPHERLKRHNAGKGSRYTRQGRPWRVVWMEPHDSRSKAIQRQYEVQALPREEKLLLTGLAA